MFHVMLKTLIWLAVFTASTAPARDLGQWDGVDPLHRQWFNELRQPDDPHLPCCGLADGDWG